jgi:hypothetical protein
VKVLKIVYCVILFSLLTTFIFADDFNGFIFSTPRSEVIKKLGKPNFTSNDESTIHDCYTGQVFLTDENVYDDIIVSYVYELKSEFLIAGIYYINDPNQNAEFLQDLYMLFYLQYGRPQKNDDQENSVYWIDHETYIQFSYIQNEEETMGEISG